MKKKICVLKSLADPVFPKLRLMRVQRKWQRKKRLKKRRRKKKKRRRRKRKKNSIRNRFFMNVTIGSS